MLRQGVQAPPQSSATFSRVPGALCTVRVRKILPCWCLMDVPLLPQCNILITVLTPVPCPILTHRDVATGPGAARGLWSTPYIPRASRNKINATKRLYNYSPFNYVSVKSKKLFTLSYAAIHSRTHLSPCFPHWQEYQFLCGNFFFQYQIFLLMLPLPYVSLFWSRLLTILNKMITTLIKLVMEMITELPALDLLVRHFLSLKMPIQKEKT